MNREEFRKEIKKLGLTILDDGDGLFSIRRGDIANPLLFYDETKSGKDYTGSVIVKSINIPLYSSEQVYQSLLLVDKYLSTRK